MPSQDLQIELTTLPYSPVSTSAEAASPGTTSTGFESPRRQAFVTTHWSVVLTAARNDTTRAHEALAHLCQTYWYPLYAFIRRRGHNPHDAQDLTQEFFARLVQKDYLLAADREKGRFRTFLIVMLKRFLANEWDRLRAQKRGGGQMLISLDASTAETRYQTEPSRDLPPDRLYERRWALALLDKTMTRLRGESVAAGKAHEFDKLKIFLTAEKGTIAYADVASELGFNEGAARVAVHRLRRRFREIFHDEIAQTVSDPGEIEEEVRHLLAILGDS